MDALLALIGVLISASVALVGYLFKRQSDERLVQEREQTEKRLKQQHAEEGARLRLDAAMRAGSLFGTSQDSPANPASSAAGLLALTELGHADLAVALLVDLWSVHPELMKRSMPIADFDADESQIVPSDARVSTETAILVINAALQAHDVPNAQLVASELLCRNATRLDPCQSLHWPAAVDGRWLPDLAPRAKLLIMNGLILMTTRKMSADESALRSLVVRLYGIWHGDYENERVQGCVGVLIDALIPALERLNNREFMQSGQTVTLDQLRLAAESASPNPDGYLERMIRAKAQLLEVWSASCGKCDLARENLGSAAY